jgi:SAM-dependent methyltransferase
MIVHIDTPAERMIAAPFVQITGWCAGDRSELGNLALTVGESVLPHDLVDRPDVRAAYPNDTVLGFSGWLNMSRYLDFAAAGRFLIGVVLNGHPVCQLDLQLAPGVLSLAAAGAKAFEEKRRWCLEHVRCPICGDASRLVSAGPEISCGSCRTSFPQKAGAINLLTPSLAETSHLRPTANVSAHNYDPIALEIIQSVRTKGGKVLDCGAGLRSGHDATVVNLEIVDYPTTDVIGVGESLPFKDGSFDAAFSLAVLEHVADPFACAKEIARVLKPGASLYCVVPFLQPEHGYPNHFYNMTRQGIANLFSGELIVDRHFVPASGLPIWGLHSILTQYRAHLSEPLREKFNNMTVRDLLANAPVDLLEEELVTALDEEGNWILACTTALIMHKPT